MRRQVDQIGRLLDDLSNGVCLTSRELHNRLKPVDLKSLNIRTNEIQPECNLCSRIL